MVVLLGARLSVPFLAIERAAHRRSYPIDGNRMKPDYLLLGHFTRDVLPHGATAPGGTSLYASSTAQRLGQRVGVVSAPAELPPDLLETIMVAFHDSPT